LADASKIRITFYLEEEIFKITEGIRIAICKIDLIVIIKKLVIPFQCEKRLIFDPTFAITIFIVFNIFPSSMPTQVLLLRLSLRVNYNFHSHFVEVVEFILIENFELDSMSLTGI
jgi:hypothetical protein